MFEFLLRKEKKNLFGSIPLVPSNVSIFENSIT